MVQEPLNADARQAPVAAGATVRSLRLWPGLAVGLGIVLVRFVVPRVVPDAGMLAILGGVVGGLVAVLWWLFFSRALWAERLGAVAWMILALLVTRLLVHPSIANGMMGMMLPIFALPVLGLGLVAGALVGQTLSPTNRRAALGGAIALSCGVFTLLRTGGITGDGVSDLHWRWSATPEERLLARTEEPPPLSAAAPAPRDEATAAPSEPEWAGFRGAARDGIVRGVRIETDWSRAAPVELWRRPIGPGWSSFAVQGARLYTQEQRGDDELVSCYDRTSGVPVWQHRDTLRFWESNAGAGPRATPTLHAGRVYALGATGRLNALDARDGAVVWSRDAAADTERALPGWGFAGSPLVVGDLVIVAVAGRLVGYELATGKPRWVGPAEGGGYSSAHCARIGGVEQVLILNGEGVLALAPADGARLWSYAWPSDGIVQPAVLADGDVLIGSGSGLGARVGLRRIAIARDDTRWSVSERWTSTGLKPYFNDFVVHAGFAYGFDGSLLACVDLADGKRRWKGGRYGNGQAILLADQGALLVLSEEGELALVAASPDDFQELARVPALTGKTWNHPVLVGDLLLVRNAEEMVAFRLSLAERLRAPVVPPTMYAR